MRSGSGSHCPVATRLQKLYLAFQEAAKLSKRLATKASPPLLLVPHERWTSAHVKVLVVGQETRRWVYDPNDIGEAGDPIKTFRDFVQAEHGVDAMCSLYRWYALGRVHPKLNSPFWRGFRAIDSAVNHARDAALWTNIFKVNVNGSVMRNCRTAEISALQRAQKGLLREEIQILGPDVVVFFSGPRYDSALRFEFPDMELSALSRRRSPAVVAVVRAAGLPPRTIRTYHPEYLQRSRQLGLIGEISRWAISEAAAGHLWVPPISSATVLG
jgi:hypothetical protein